MGHHPSQSGSKLGTFWESNIAMETHPFMRDFPSIPIKFADSPLPCLIYRRIHPIFFSGYQHLLTTNDLIVTGAVSPSGGYSKPPSWKRFLDPPAAAENDAMPGGMLFVFSTRTETICKNNWKLKQLQSYYMIFMVNIEKLFVSLETETTTKLLYDFHGEYRKTICFYKRRVFSFMFVSQRNPQQRPIWKIQTLGALRLLVQMLHNQC